ncbi:MAG TPA: hypothetical protein VH349_02600 [Ktedonobacterales bacterium]
MSYDEPPETASSPELTAPPARITSGTVIGCLGILCVFAMPALLFLPVETWGAPTWVILLAPLLAFGIVALGGWLLWLVPATRVPRSDDPLRPLTATGEPPLLERPATARNRVTLVIVVALLACGALGYVVAAFDLTGDASVLMGIALAGLAGICLAILAALVGGGYVPSPAWRWARQPIQQKGARSSWPLLLGGLTLLAWALTISVFYGYWWGALGAGLLVVGGVAAAPLARRLPWRGTSDAL